MTFKPSSFGSVTAITAAIAMSALPAAAAELPAISLARPDTVQTGDAGELNQYRYRRHRYRDRGIDAGDVVAGVLVVGAIAALAGAFDGDNDDRRDRRDERYPRRDDARYDRSERYESDGIGRAADMCVDQVERGPDRVDDVTDAARRSDGWHVSGTLDNGEGWTCWIDNQGRIRNVDFGSADYSADSASDDRYATVPAAGGQWSDAAYARARASTRTPAEERYGYRIDEDGTPAAEGPQPAYPGGPLPGEEGYGADDFGIDADLSPAR